MNAQEAIEKIEQELAQIDDLIDERNKLELDGYISEEQRMEDEEEYNEMKTALSIVLESAKLFHEHYAPHLIIGNVRFSQSKQHKTVYGVPLRKVGIELEEEKVEEVEE